VERRERKVESKRRTTMWEMKRKFENEVRALWSLNPEPFRVNLQDEPRALSDFQGGMPS
jgi:hypothetical protein